MAISLSNFMNAPQNAYTAVISDLLDQSPGNPTLSNTAVGLELPPTFISAATNAAGNQVILTYDQALSATTALAGAFAVNGSANNVTGVPVVNGNTVVLNLTTAVTSGQTVTVGYTAPSADPATTNNAIQNAGGDDAPSLVATPVNNTTAVVDATPPTATITLADSELTVDETTTVTITFSETVNSFTVGDLTAQNGTLSNLTGAGANWTATLTPTANISDTSNVITLAANSVTDAANLPNAVTTSANYTVNTAAVDTLPPTATIALADSALTTGETSLVTITFSEAVTGFALTDLVAENGALTNLVQNPTNPLVWTATLTPTANITDTSNIITLAANSVTDTANLPNAVTTSANYTVNTVAAGSATPVTVTTGNTAPYDASTANVAFTFNNTSGTNYTYNVAGFNTGDVLNFANGAQLEVQNTSITDNAVTVVAGVNGSVLTIQLTGLAAGQDTFGLTSVDGFNTAFGPAALVAGIPTVDNVLPTLFSSTPADGATGVAVNSNLALTFSEPVKLGTAGSITLMDGATPIVMAVTDPAVTVAGSVITINPAVDLTSSTHYSVQITTGAIKDMADNDYVGIAATDTTTLDFTTAAGGTTGSATPVAVTTGNTTPYDASTANVAFTFSNTPGTNYTYNVAGFNAGDVLDFADGAQLEVQNTSITDNAVTVVAGVNGSVLTIQLTGLAAGQDTFGLTTVDGFNALFGSAALI